MAFRDLTFWKDAINDEMDSIMLNHTWKLVNLPYAFKPNSCKWIFKRRYNTNGTLNTFKIRLVVKGFRKNKGIDYFYTYTPIARITSIRIVFALGLIYNLQVMAILNGDLDEEVYKGQLEKFVLPGNEHKVCKLVKSLYGLK